MQPAEEVLTAGAGSPLFVRAERSLGVPASLKQRPEVNRRQRGLDEATLVESFLALNAGAETLAGGGEGRRRRTLAGSRFGLHK